MWVIVLAMTVPTLVFGGSLFVLIQKWSNQPQPLQALEMVMNCVPVVAIAYPILISCVFYVALQITDNIVGPVDRVVREIDARLYGGARGPIRIREKDALVPLVDRINQVLECAERRDGLGATPISIHVGVDSANEARSSAA